MKSWLLLAVAATVLAVAFTSPAEACGRGRARAAARASGRVVVKAVNGVRRVLPWNR